MPTPSSPASQAIPPRNGRILEPAWALALASCFLLLGLLCLRKIWDMDLGFYLGAGRWIAQNRQLPTHDVFTYTVADHPYLEVQWAFDLLLYGLYRTGGYTLLSFFNVALILLAFALSWVRLRRAYCPPWAALPLLAAAILICEFRFHLRAENLSWALLGGMLWVLEEYADRGRNLLFLLPLLEVLWVNTEGIYPLGWALAALFLVSSRIRTGRWDLRLLSYFLQTLAVVLLNPYGYRILRVPFAILETLHSDVFTRNIMEFLSPWNPANAAFLPSGLWAYKGFSILLFLGMALTFRHRKLRDWFLAGLFFYLSAFSVRNIPLFLLACLPIAGLCLRDSAEARWGQRAGNFLARRGAALLWTVLLLGLGLRVFTDAYYVSGQRPDHFGWGLDRDRIPDQAAGFLAQNHLDGRILNDMPLGDWLDWQGSQKVFIDSRLEVMGKDLFTEYVQAREPGGLTALAERRAADILAFTLPNPWVNDLAGSKDWRAVFTDGTAVIYLRQGYAPQVPALEEDRIWQAEGVPDDIRAQAPVLLRLPVLPAWQVFTEGFLRRQVYSYRLAHLGAFLFLTSHPASGEALYLEAIRRAEGRYPAFYLNLGQFYYAMGRYAEARLCLGRVLSQDPGNATARRIFEKLPSTS